MPRSRPSRPHPLSWVAATAAGLMALSGCMTTAPRDDSGTRTETIRVPAADGEATRRYLAELAELATSPPARQAEMLNNARVEAESSPTTTNRLRYALMLADPSHGGTDPVAARRQLSEILARPEWALPSERALAGLALRETEVRLSLAEDARRVQADAGSRDREKLALATRRLAAEQDENARLKKALDEAQKKLDAVSQLERAGKERGNAQGGT